MNHSEKALRSYLVTLRRVVRERVSTSVKAVMDAAIEFLKKPHPYGDEIERREMFAAFSIAILREAMNEPAIRRRFVRLHARREEQSLRPIYLHIGRMLFSDSINKAGDVARLLSDRFRDIPKIEFGRDGLLYWIEHGEVWDDAKVPLEQRLPDLLADFQKLFSFLLDTQRSQQLDACPVNWIIFLGPLRGYPLLQEGTDPYQNLKAERVGFTSTEAVRIIEGDFTQDFKLLQRIFTAQKD